jgi:hypothetical protein
LISRLAGLVSPKRPNHGNRLLQKKAKVKPLKLPKAKLGVMG